MVNRDELEKSLEKYSYKYSTDTELYNLFIRNCYKWHNIPIGLSSDYISLRRTYSDCEVFILYCMFDTILKIENSTDNAYVSKMSKFFTEKEMKKFSNLVYEEESLKFPIIIKAIKVNEDQWIGTISSKELMLMRKAQIINYEENTQRVKRRVVKGDNVFYEISLKKKAINEIYFKLIDGNYISDDLTLNIPYESNADFYYDENKCQLVIKSIKAFDMIDGYHRYISLCKSSDSDDDFDYNMEIRITNFDESKCQRFIYQKDQKTKMSKVDSDTYNPDSLANLVVTRLNENPMSNIKGMISRNDGLINFAEIASIIKYTFFKYKVPKSEERVAVLGISTMLIRLFNLYTEKYPSFLRETHSFKEIAIIITFFNMHRDDPEEIIPENLFKIIKNMDLISDKKFSGRVMKKSAENEILKFV